MLSEMTPFDPAVRNAWGSVLDVNFTLIDSAIAGTLALDVSGGANVTLTSVQGAPDQARNADFTFTGLLTGNIAVFWPVGRNRFFSVTNATTGAFSLTIAVVGTPGTVVAVPQGQTMLLKSDGTNISQRALPFGATGVLAIANGGTGAITAALARAALAVAGLADNNTYSGTATFQKQTVGPPSVVAFAATVTLDLATANNFQLTMQGGAVTLANPTNAVAGQSGVIEIVQDNTTPRLITYGANWKFPSGIAPPLTATVNAIDVLSYNVRSPTFIEAAMSKDFK